MNSSRQLQRNRAARRGSKRRKGLRAKKKATPKEAAENSLRPEEGPIEPQQDEGQEQMVLDQMAAAAEEACLWDQECEQAFTFSDPE